MKTTNIFHKLKASGAYNTDGMKPQLPGLGSPLDKKLIGNQKNLPQELKDKIEAAPETSPANYGSPYKKYKSDAQRKAVHASKAENKSTSPTNKNGNKPKLISKEEDPKTGITTRKYDVGTNMTKIVKTKKKTSTFKKLGSSPAKKGCSPTKLVPEEVEGRKPKTRRNKAQKRVNKMLGGLANANRGCKPHRKIKSR